MRRLRAILIGVIAAEAFVFATAGPWRRLPPPAGGHVVGFSGDGRTCFGLVHPSVGDADDAEAMLYAWDTATGRGRVIPLSDAAISPSDTLEATILPDGRSVLVVSHFGPSVREPRWFDPVRDRCRLFSTVTGAVVAEPRMPTTPGYVEWSPDVRRVADCSAVRGLFLPEDEVRPLVVWAVPTGREVARISARSDEKVRDFLFAGDGVIVLRQRTDPGHESAFVVERVALPWGQVVGRAALPPADRWNLVRWECGRVRVSRETLKGRWSISYELLDFTADPPRLTPAADRDELTFSGVSRTAGPTWVATTLIRDDTDLLPAGLRPLAKRVGWALPQAAQPRRCAVRLTAGDGRPLPSPTG